MKGGHKFIHECSEACSHKMKSLQQISKPFRKTEISSFVSSYIELDHHADDFVLSAMHDLFSGIQYFVKYAKKNSTCTTLYCPITKSSHISFIGYCPHCSSLESHDVWLPNKNERNAIKKNKPQSDEIGTICSEISLELLMLILKEEIEMFNITDRVHDVDAIIKYNHMISLWEIKSSPMFLPSFEIENLTESTKHIIGDANWSEGSMKMRVPGTKSTAEISFSHESSDLQLESFQLRCIKAMEKDNFQFAKDFVQQWIRNYSEFISGSHSNLKFLRAGGSAKTDDSKNQPGINRTDDLKKASYQLLKYTGHYKALCSNGNIYGGIITNLGPIASRDPYFKGIYDLKIVQGHENSYLCDAILSLDSPVAHLYNPDLRCIMDR